MTNNSNEQIENESWKTYLSYRIRIKSSDIGPDWLTDTTGVNPSWKFIEGAEHLVQRPDGAGGWKEISSTYPFSVWGLTTKGVLDSNNLEKHCEYLSNILDSKRLIFEELVSKNDIFDIGLLVRVETADYIFSDSMTSGSLSVLLKLSHFIDFSTIFVGKDTT